MPAAIWRTTYGRNRHDNSIITYSRVDLVVVVFRFFRLFVVHSKFIIARTGWVFEYFLLCFSVCDSGYVILVNINNNILRHWSYVNKQINAYYDYVYEIAVDLSCCSHWTVRVLQFWMKWICCRVSSRFCRHYWPPEKQIKKKNALCMRSRYVVSSGS